jgi:hypothetical protein
MDCCWRPGREKSSRDPIDGLSCAPAHPFAAQWVPRVTSIGFQSRKFNGAQHEVSTSKISCQDRQWHLEERGKNAPPYPVGPWIPEIKLLSPNNLLK